MEQDMPSPPFSETVWSALRGSADWEDIAIPLLVLRRQALYEKLGIAGSIEDVRYLQGAIAAITAPLTEPTSETMAFGSKAGAIASAISRLAPTGAQRITQSAAGAASATSATYASPSPSASRPCCST